MFSNFVTFFHASLGHVTCKPRLKAEKLYLWKAQYWIMFHLILKFGFPATLLHFTEKYYVYILCYPYKTKSWRRATNYTVVKMHENQFLPYFKNKEFRNLAWYFDRFWSALIFERKLCKWEITQRKIWLFVLKSFYERADTFNIYYVASVHMCSLW